MNNNFNETMLIQATSASTLAVTVGTIRTGKISEIAQTYTIDPAIFDSSTLDDIILVSDVLGDYVRTPDAAIQLRKVMVSSADHDRKDMPLTNDLNDILLTHNVSNNVVSFRESSVTSANQQNTNVQTRHTTDQMAERLIKGDISDEAMPESTDEQVIVSLDEKDISSGQLSNDSLSDFQNEFDTLFEDDGSVDFKSDVYDDLVINNGDDFFDEEFQEEDIGYLFEVLDFDGWEYGDLPFEDIDSAEFFDDEDDFYNEVDDIEDNFNNEVDDIEDDLFLDDSAPTIACEGGSPYQYEVGSDDPLPMVSATDQEDGTLSVEVNYSPGFDLTVLGEYTITYTAIDSDFNTTTEYQDIYVVDTTAPMFASVSSAINPDYPLVLDAVPEEFFLTDGAPYEQMFELTDRDDILSVGFLSQHDPVTSYGDNFLYVYGVSDESGNGTFLSSSVVTSGGHLSPQIQQDFMTALSSADAFVLDGLAPAETYVYNSTDAAFTVFESDGLFEAINIFMFTENEADPVGSYDAHFQVYYSNDVQQAYDDQLF